MCGLLSFLGGEPDKQGRIAAALATLRQRGPDDFQTWLSPGGRLALGHTRLAIVDPPGGGHPVRNETGSVVAIVNGEFYGYPLLRAELQQRGHTFASFSDSEVLVHLYEEFGVDCLTRLRGEFAFLLWDEERQRLWAVRDRFGVKPLLYARIGSDWCFASKARAFFAAGLSPRWDEASFHHVCSTQYTPTDATLFQGIRQIPPGHFALLEANDLPDRISTRAYWDLPRSQPDPSLDADDFGHELDVAVRLRLPPDPPGCAFHLSGGLDSASVVALARQSLDRAEVFTISFEDPDYDELALAEEVAELCGANLHRLALSPAELLAALEPAVQQSEGLAVNAHLSAKFWLNQAISERGFKVALTGEGSDEVLLGYPHFRQDLNAGALADDFLQRNRASAGIMLSAGPTLNLAGVQAELGWVPSFLRAKGALGYRLHSLMQPEFLGDFQDRDPFCAMLTGADLKGRTRLDQASYLWCKSALCNYILQTLGDGCEMAHSVEGRLPFLDHHLVELLARFPLDSKIHAVGEDWVEKWILREAMRPLLPHSIINRPKHPFMAPPLSIASQSLQDELLQAARHHRVPFCCAQRLESQLARVALLPEAERREWDPVWMWLLTAHYLQRTLGLA